MSKDDVVDFCYRTILQGSLRLMYVVSSVSQVPPTWTLPSSVLQKVWFMDIETNRGGTVMPSAQWSWKVTPSLRGRDTQQGSVKKLTQMSPSLLQSTALSLSLIHTNAMIHNRILCSKTTNMTTTKDEPFRKILLHVHNMMSSSVIIIIERKDCICSSCCLISWSAYIMGINLHLQTWAWKFSTGVDLLSIWI